MVNRGGYLNLVEIKIEIIGTIWSRGKCLTIQLTPNKRKEIEMEGTNYVSAPIKNLLHGRAGQRKIIVLIRSERNGQCNESFTAFDALTEMVR